MVWPVRKAMTWHLAYILPIDQNISIEKHYLFMSGSLISTVIYLSEWVWLNRVWWVNKSMNTKARVCLLWEMDHSLAPPDPSHPQIPSPQPPVYPTPIQTVTVRLHLVSCKHQHSYTVCVGPFVILLLEVYNNVELVYLYQRFLCAPIIPACLPSCL